MTLQSPVTVESKPSLESQTPYQKCGQRLSNDGKIIVSKKAWAVRITALVAVTFIIAYNISLGLQSGGDPLVLYTTILPVHSLMYVLIAWIFYRNLTRGQVGNDLVSVIIPIYNQKSMIKIVIDAIYRSTYQNLEVIAVDDGSKDGSREILDNLVKIYPDLKVIRKEKNEGKRKAIASGFYASEGKYVVLIDSDSVVDEQAITEFMKVFNGDKTIGAVVGNAKVGNARKNILTRCQDVWYDYSFNIRKASESTFGTVLCCSGCLAAYRREAITHYIPYWIRARLPNSDDRELTTSVILAPFAKKLMESMAQYDDAEDRGLTAQAMVNWKSVYVPTARVYTDVPENWKVFLKQQKRWKKGTTRVNFFMSAFFWRKNPIMSLLIFYIDFMMTFTTPLIVITVFFYEPFILQNFLMPTSFMIGTLLLSFVHGLDYKFRDPNARNWMYKPLMNLITTFVLAWLIFPALLSYKKNEWGTR